MLIPEHPLIVIQFEEQSKQDEIFRIIDFASFIDTNAPRFPEFQHIDVGLLHLGKSQKWIEGQLAMRRMKYSL